MNELQRLESSRLTFDWFRQHSVSYILPALLIGALVAHLAALYVFGAGFPSPVAILPPPGQVTFLSRGSEQNDALLKWIEAQDPALVGLRRSAPPPELLDVPYTPSFAEVRALPRRPQIEPAPVTFPPARPLSSFTNALPSQGTKSLKLPPPPTRVEFSPALATRQIGEAPLSVYAQPGTILRPTVFFVGVNSDGLPSYVFVRATSGDQRIDREAEIHLASRRFHPSDLAVEWGTVTIVWGADAHGVAARSP